MPDTNGPLSEQVPSSSTYVASLAWPSVVLVSPIDKCLHGESLAMRD